MVAQVGIKIKNIDKLKRDLEAKYGPGAMRRKGRAALSTAAKATIVPAVVSEIPSGDRTSPWRTGRHDNPKVPGPMRSRVVVTSPRLRAGEHAAIHIGIRHYATNVVIRGGKPHEQPNHPFRKKHPGSRPNDIFGKAGRKSTQAFVAAVQTEIGKL